ncbi:MAG: hypothetical protein F4Y77_12985 [Holophagales bacterium]|nr:hypothetical protein [Holophagales bacterium]
MKATDARTVVHHVDGQVLLLVVPPGDTQPTAVRLSVEHAENLGASLRAEARWLRAEGMPPPPLIFPDIAKLPDLAATGDYALKVGQDGRNVLFLMVKQGRPDTDGVLVPLQAEGARVLAHGILQAADRVEAIHSDN